jgi:hypothetical protein
MAGTFSIRPNRAESRFLKMSGKAFLLETGVSG